ncbi:MAG: phosphatase PAP2 family protein [bacterium]
MRNRILILILFFLAVSINAQEQEGRWEIFKNDVSSAWDDFGNVGTQLGSIGWKEVGYTGLFIGADVLLMQYDEDIRSLFWEKKDSLFVSKHGSEKAYFEIVNEFGSVYSALAFPSVIYLSGLAFSNEELRTSGRLLTEAMLLSTAITQVIKISAGRSRPFNNEGNNTWKPFTFTDSNYSFPSGHTTVAFTIATVLSHRIDKWWAYASLYTLAASTGVARIYFDKHWASDVLMGAGIGTVSALLILNANEKTKNDKTSEGFNFSPGPYLFSVSYSF